MPFALNQPKRTINKKVTILGSSGSPEKGNLIKLYMRTATASYKNVKNYALHVFTLSGRILEDLLYTVHPVSMGFGALLKEIIQTTCRPCRKRNHPFDTSRFNVVPTDTIPTHLRPCSSPLLVGNADDIGCSCILLSTLLYPLSIVIPGCTSYESNLKHNTSFSSTYIHSHILLLLLLFFFFFFM